MAITFGKSKKIRRTTASQAGRDRQKRINKNRLITPVNVRNSSAKVNPFELLINETFPVPEAVRLDFEVNDQDPFRPYTKITGLKMKAEISGDFLDDEWFWADYLKYFRIKAYVVVDITGEVLEPLLSEKNMTSRKVFPIRKSLKDRTNSYSLLELENKSNKLTNSYVFEGEVKFSDQAIISLRDATSAIILRTYFDMQGFVKEMLPGKGVSELKPLEDDNNGKWDLIVFSVNEEYDITQVRRRYHHFLGITPEVIWDGPFSVVGGIAYATADYQSNQSVSILKIKDIAFNKTNISDIKSAKLFYAREQARIKAAAAAAAAEAARRAQELADRVEEIQTAFSNLFIGIMASSVDKEIDGAVSLTFSLDYIKLAEKLLTSLPPTVFGFVKLISNKGVFRTINIIDKDKKTTGVYKYQLFISFKDRTKKEVERLNNLIGKAQNALNTMLTALQSKPEYYDSTADEVSEEFQFADSYDDLKNRYDNDFINGFLDVLDYNPLNFFAFNKFEVHRIRVKSESNIEDFDSNAPPDIIAELQEDEDTEEFLQIGGSAMFEEITPKGVYDIDAFPLAGTTRKDMEEDLKLENVTLSGLQQKQVLLAKASNYFNQLVTKLQQTNSQSSKNSQPKSGTQLEYEIPFQDLYNAGDKKDISAISFYEDFRGEAANNIPNVSSVTLFPDRFTDETLSAEILFLSGYENNKIKSPIFQPVIDIDTVSNPDLIGSKILCKIQPSTTMPIPFYYEYFIGTIAQIQEEDEDTSGSPPPEGTPPEREQQESEQQEQQEQQDEPGPIDTDQQQAAFRTSEPGGFGGSY